MPTPSAAPEAAVIVTPAGLERRRDASRLGMWVLLITEVLLFGGLFTGYAMYRARYPAGFAEGSRLLEVGLGALNTFVLLASSLFVALATHAAGRRARGRLLLFLFAAIALGTLFLGIKGYEWAVKIRDGLVPGTVFATSAKIADPVRLFLALYFVMTGAHALHLLIGIAVMSVLFVRSLWHTAGATTVELAGLYWHFVDVVWLFLFPLFYLVGRHG